MRDIGNSLNNLILSVCDPQSDMQCNGGRTKVKIWWKPQTLPPAQGGNARRSHRGPGIGMTSSSLIGSAWGLSQRGLQQKSAKTRGTGHAQPWTIREGDLPWLFVAAEGSCSGRRHLRPGSHSMTTAAPMPVSGREAQTRGTRVGLWVRNSFSWRISCSAMPAYL